MNKFLKIVMLALFALPLGAVAKGQVIEPLSDTVKVAETSAAYNHSVRRQNRGISNLKTEFVPKGQWVFGGAVSYSRTIRS